MIINYFPILGEINIVSILVRIILALVCSGMIGYERGKEEKAAGFRTHMLVCLGTAITMITGEFMFLKYPTVDPSRIGAQAIAALGFLGAGTIMISRDRHVSGLTTAAGLWASACVGLALGAGFYELGILGTLAILFIENILKSSNKSFPKSDVDPKDPGLPED